MRGLLRARWALPLGLLTALVLVLAPPAPALAAAGPPGSARAALAAITAQPTLRLGSRGTAVVGLQRRLAALHYDVGGADGVFGSDTLHAVVAFQKVNRLARDGVVGPRTWAALARPVVPRARYRYAGSSVEVDLTRQVVFLVRAGAIVRVLDASTGKASTPTPTGRFRIQRRINGWRQSPLGLMWRPNYFWRGYALHGSTSVPAWPASHGCVRLTVPAMNRLWSLLAVGMPLAVYRS